MLIYLPSYKHIIELHDSILIVSGGKSGVLDKNVIHSAIARPKTYLSYHPDCDLHVVCAVIIDSLARNHAFVEGNKRTGLLAAVLTYELNGIALDSSADCKKELEDLVLWVVVEKPTIQEIANTFKKIVNVHKKDGISKFVERLKSAIKPFWV